MHKINLIFYSSLSLNQVINLQTRNLKEIIIEQKRGSDLIIKYNLLFKTF